MNQVNFSPIVGKAQFGHIDRGDCSKANIKAAKKALWLTDIRRYRVIYLKGKKECKSCWIDCHDRAKSALDSITGKGYQAVIYID